MSILPALLVGQIWRKHYARVAAVTPTFEHVGNPEERVPVIVEAIHEAAARGAEVIVLPELVVCGYTCMDLFRDPNFVRRCMAAADQVSHQTKHLDVTIVYGSPWLENSKLYNVAIVSRAGEIGGIVKKRYLPTGGEFQEARWFEPGEDEPVQVFTFDGAQSFTFVVAVCEDDWHLLSPGSVGAAAGAHLRVNISGSNFLAGKRARRRQMFDTMSWLDAGAFLYVSVGSGEDTTDLVFDGDRFIYDNGRLLAEGDAFTDGIIVADIDLTAIEAARLYNRVSTHAKIPPFRHISLGLRAEPTVGGDISLLRPTEVRTPHVLTDPKAQLERCYEIDEGSIRGMVIRIKTAGLRKLSIGLSGGRDSTRAALILALACDRLKIPRSRVQSFTLTGPASREITQELSRKLGEGLGFTHKTVDITDMAASAARAVDHEPCWGADGECLICENAQARARTFILMTAGAVIGTGNESEGEDGYSTYNGDHMSMYNPNGSLPKTLIISDIMALALRSEFVNVREVIEDILGQPISAELGIGQTTEAAVGDTELVDWFFFHFRKGRSAGQVMLLASQSFSEWSIADLATLFAKLTRAHARSQYKRDAAPGAPLLGSMSTSQRGILRLPSDLRAYDHVAQQFDEFAKLAA